MDHSRGQRIGIPLGVVPNEVVARCIDAYALDLLRCHELGLEALSELAVEALGYLEHGRDIVSRNFFVRLSGVSLSAWGERTPSPVATARPLRYSKMLGMCLTQMLDLIAALLHERPQPKWQLLRDTLHAWLRCWSVNEHPSVAMACFSTLTGLTADDRPKTAYLHAALATVLAGVEP